MLNPCRRPRTVGSGVKTGEEKHRTSPTGGKTALPKEAIIFSQRTGMKKYIIFFVFTLLLSSLCLFPALAAPGGSCVACHTSESMMKSMHKPPSLPASTGEG